MTRHWCTEPKTSATFELKFRDFNSKDGGLDRSVERRKKGGQIRFAAAWRKIRLKSGRERESNVGGKKWNTEERRGRFMED